jgi:fido (protein-threonine AMPylation protein)
MQRSEIMSVLQLKALRAVIDDLEYIEGAHEVQCEEVERLTAENEKTDKIKELIIKQYATINSAAGFISGCTLSVMVKIILDELCICRMYKEAAPQKDKLISDLQEEAICYETGYMIHDELLSKIIDDPDCVLCVDEKIEQLIEKYEKAISWKKIAQEKHDKLMDMERKYKRLIARIGRESYRQASKVLKRFRAAEKKRGDK